MDNCAAHKRFEIRDWLTANPSERAAHVSGRFVSTTPTCTWIITLPIAT
jgi:hypothetical protein